jgi:hypothetical protein
VAALHRCDGQLDLELAVGELRDGLTSVHEREAAAPVGTRPFGLRDGLLDAVRGERPQHLAERAVLAPDPGVERRPADPEFLGERAHVEPLTRDPAPAR